VQHAAVRGRTRHNRGKTANDCHDRVVGNAFESPGTSRGPFGPPGARCGSCGSHGVHLRPLWFTWASRGSFGPPGAFCGSFGLREASRDTFRAPGASRSSCAPPPFAHSRLLALARAPCDPFEPRVARWGLLRLPGAFSRLLGHNAHRLGPPAPVRPSWRLRARLSRLMGPHGVRSALSGLL
jgi:hypothetical protein